MEVDNLETTERGTKGFGSSDMSPKRSIQANEENVTICFLHVNQEENEFFGAKDICQHTRLLEEEEMLSTARVNAALTRTMNNTFLEEVRTAGKKNDKWLELGQELIK